MSSETPSEYYARITYGQYMVAVRLADEAPDDPTPAGAAYIAAKVAEAARLAVIYADGVVVSPSKRARKYALAALELSAAAAQTALFALLQVGDDNDDTGR